MKVTPEVRKFFSDMGKASAKSRGLTSMTKEERSEYMKRIRRGEKINT